MIRISLRDPFQSLIDYIVDNYQLKDTRCERNNCETDIEKCVDCCSRSYYGTSIQYKCENSKKVYLHKYLASHMKEINFAISQSVIEQIGEQHEINAMSVGGGPGTEALSLMFSLEAKGNEHTLFFDNFEFENSWEEIFRDIVNTAQSFIFGVKNKIDFIQFDIRKEQVLLTDHYDIIFLSWILSEIGHTDRIEAINNLSRQLTSNGFLVITERFQTPLISQISQIIQESNRYTLESSEEVCEIWDNQVT